MNTMTNPGWYFKAPDQSFWLTTSVGETLTCRRVRKMTYKEFRRLKIGNVVRMGVPSGMQAELFIVVSISQKDKEVHFRGLRPYPVRRLPTIGEVRSTVGYYQRRLRPNAQGGHIIERVA
jgi:hypothetical protein